MYLFNANAIGLAGFFTRPFQAVIEPQTSATLASVGGYAHARTEGFNFREIVSVRSAYAETSGSMVEENRVTSARAVVEGLNILDIVTADRVVAILSGKHRRGDVESSIRVAGTHFENLRIGGQPIDLDMKTLLVDEHSTFSDLKGLYSRERSHALPIVSLGEGAYRTSLARYHHEGPGWKQNGLAIEVANFGRIYLAELIVQPSYRRLNMLRLELGSPVAGRVVVASASCNGLAGDAGKDDD